jgi:acetyl esterase/lipase
MRARRIAVLPLAFALGAAQPVPEYSRKSDVIYGRRAGVALTMEVLAPSRPNGAGVIWVASSGGMSNREQTFDPSFDRRVLPLLSRGYVVFAVIHGSAPVFQVPDFIEDVRRSVRFVRTHPRDFGVDERRLALAGSSSGGAIALTVAMSGDDGSGASRDEIDRASSRVAAVGCFFAPTDFLNVSAPSVTLLDLFRERGVMDPSFQFMDVDPKTGARRFIEDRDRQLQILRDVSPISHATSDDPATILIHGDADKAVPIQQSRRLADRLRELDVPVRLVVRQGMRHAWPGWEADSDLLAEWFDTHLRRSAR